MTSGVHIPKHASRGGAAGGPRSAAIYAARHRTVERDDGGADIAPVEELGAVAADAVASQLRKLGPGWHVVHAVPLGARGTDIDHVVIGPAGVFTIACKRHFDEVRVDGNAVRVDGARTDYVRASRLEAAYAAHRLSAVAGQSIEVQGVIAVVGARHDLTIAEQPANVQVVSWTSVAKYLSALPRKLWPHDVDALHEFASRPTTWRPSAG